MKTKSTHPTKIGEKTNTRNLFQKSFILLAILAFTSFGFKAKAQTTTLTITNNAPIFSDWLIVFCEANGNPITTYTSYGGSGLTNTNCISTLLIDHFTIHYIPGGCIGYIFGSGASWPYTAVLPSCGGTTSIDVQGGAATQNCAASPPIGDYNITININ